MFEVKHRYVHEHVDLWHIHARRETLGEAMDEFHFPAIDFCDDVLLCVVSRGKRYAFGVMIDGKAKEVPLISTMFGFSDGMQWDEAWHHALCDMPNVRVQIALTCNVEFNKIFLALLACIRATKFLTVPTDELARYIKYDIEIPDMFTRSTASGPLKACWFLAQAVKELRKPSCNRTIIGYRISGCMETLKMLPSPDLIAYSQAFCENISLLDLLRNVPEKQ